MVSIIKNQILKHLSKFTKNLSSDKINLSTFRGEGELSGLELNEIVLTDLLELPSWLRLTSAWCNKVAFRIQWAKLKSVPILLSLDEVIIAVETCEQLRSTSCLQGLSSYAGAAKYSFIHKVIDGMTVTVNTVKITFQSPAFVASVTLSRILVESKSPDWQKCELSQTRIKDNDRGQVLLFKELEWQNVRIEASSTKDPDLTPLRLLTNKARCRITLKKRISDSSILGSRLAIILEDLLWVLTDLQLKAALHFLDSLAGLIQKATEVTRKQKAARKLEVLPEYQALLIQAARSKVQRPPSHLSKYFDGYDVVETSYHFLAQKIDLHFCDDPGAGRSCHPELKDGGALQVSLKMLKLDFYPYHLAAGDRHHWPMYREAAIPHAQWLRSAQIEFKRSLMELVASQQSHVPVSRTPVYNDENTSQSQPSQDQSKFQANVEIKEYITEQFSKLMTSCLILRLSDFNLYQVTTCGAKKHIPKDFISGDKDRYHLPDSEMVLHAEFTYYYYPGDDPFPIPTPKFYVLVNPIQIYFDVISLLWVNSFALNLHQSLLQTAASQDANVANIMYFDVKIEAIMPRVIFESNIDHPGQKDRPKSLHLQVSRACITNARSLDRSSRADLEKCIDSFQMGSLFFNGDFPSVTTDYHLVTNKFIRHVTGADDVRPPPPPLTATTVADLKRELTREMLWTEAKDLWCIHLEPVWGDFYGARAVGKDHSVPFLDAFPLTLWVYLKLPGGEMQTQPEESSGVSSQSSADIHALAHVSTLISLQLNHYQYLFILRLSEEAQELATYLGIDSSRIVKRPSGSSLVVGAVVPQLEVTLVMPSQSPGKESSGGDVESVFPDSSSLQDDVTATDQGQNNPIHTSLPSSQPQHPVGRCRTSVSQFSMEGRMDSIMQEPIPNIPAKAANGSARPQQLPIALKCGEETTFPFMMKSFKKGFDSLMTSLDLTSKNSPDDGSDSVSIRSDASSESDNFVQVGAADCLAGATGTYESMFKISQSGEQQRITAPQVELGTEMIEEETTLTTPSERDSCVSYCNKRRDLISMVTVKMGKVEIVQQSEGLSSAIKVQVSNITLDECTSIPWDEFQSKFISRSRGWIEVPLDEGVNPRVKLRLNHALTGNLLIPDVGPVDRTTVLKSFQNTVDLRVQNINLEVNASSVTGLIDLIEDEVLPTPLPATIWLEEVQLHINEDRPPCNITSPGPVPLDVVVKQLHVTRDGAGVVEIHPAATTAKHYGESSKSRSAERLAMENEELRRRLVALERLTEENYTLKRYQEETKGLRSRLTDAQNRVESLLNDKVGLLDKVKALQERFSEQERTSKR